MQLHNETRGFRNNNPGNIRHGEKWLWLSKKQTDPDFCQFIFLEYGIRAMFKLLDTYMFRFKFKTIREIISEWAPPRKNDTKAYIKNVCSYMSQHDFYVPPDNELMEIQELYYLVAGIIYHENGIQPFDIDFIQRCKDI